MTANLWSRMVGDQTFTVILQWLRRFARMRQLGAYLRLHPPGVWEGCESGAGSVSGDLAAWHDACNIGLA